MSGPKRSARDAEIVAMYQSRRLGLKQVAAAFGVSPQRIHQILKRNGVRFNPIGANIRHRTTAAPAGRGAP